ncbi:TetR family transcriptional regulator [Mycobacteroides chelonae]|uniref:TetR family transcriptional regulator n=1 Tax=Mycobacteroides chelonae TaxID=1774 RepID=UPI0004AA7D20|nr:TetR family transcriptional regulator [Mycobacteroides chelonae]MBF9318121.1 TetR/AcrR family transcriptional regulator [Mycobacteroides chelonae]OHT72277.1 hypothetical protein BKG67_10450 [Mycobacteroides chelonae]OHT75174.1 hypothetical protein BKG66_03035 [Mycobacteroides chelonae]OHT90109.1 hypothetical protein BKG70_06335 [Mycobacteroides chelonae]
MPGRDTRTQLLDAAEQILLKEGIGGLSMRNVTAAAKTNVGAVNYTFGGKRALLEALLERLMLPLSIERIRRLDEVTACAEHTVADLVGAYIVPLLGMEQHIAPLFVELFIKAGFQGNARLHQVGIMGVQPALDRFIDALSARLPDHSQTTLRLRVRLLLGAGALYMYEELPSIPNRRYVIDEFITVAAAALSAPTTQKFL